MANQALIESIADARVRELARRGQLRSMPRGTVFIHEGERGDSLYVILAGQVKVFVADDDGREMVLDIHEPGDYVGEMSLDGRPRAASVITMEPTVCSVLSREVLRSAIAADPDVAMHLISTLIGRARAATENVRNLALMDVYGRVARLLLSLAAEQPDGRLVVAEKLTQQEIADRVGASRDMIGKLLKDLVAGGYLLVEDRQITILKKLPPGW